MRNRTPGQRRGQPAVTRWRWSMAAEWRCAVVGGRNQSRRVTNSSAQITNHTRSYFYYIWGNMAVVRGRKWKQGAGSRQLRRDRNENAGGQPATFAARAVAGCNSRNQACRRRGNDHATSTHTAEEQRTYQSPSPASCRPARDSPAAAVVAALVRRSLLFPSRRFRPTSSNFPA